MVWVLQVGVVASTSPGLSGVGGVFAFVTVRRVLFATGITFGWLVLVTAVFGSVWTSTVATFRGVWTVRGIMVIIGLTVFTSGR